MAKSNQWNSAPYDPALTSNTNQFLVWLQQSVADLQGATAALDAPVLSTILEPNSSVRLQWSSVANAVKYNVYESLTPGVADTPIATIDANASGGQNSYVRDRKFGAFFYAVQGVGADGRQGALSSFNLANALPEGMTIAISPPGIIMSCSLSTDLTVPSPLSIRDRQPVTFIISQDAAGGHIFTWPVNVLTPGTVSLTAGAISIQSFVYYAQFGLPNGTFIPTTTMIFI